jgi:hypothetical protein
MIDVRQAAEYDKASRNGINRVFIENQTCSYNVNVNCLPVDLNYGQLEYLTLEKSLYVD